MTQVERISQTLFERPKTMLMAANDTNIERANICRAIRKLEDQNKVIRLRKGLCSISKHRATYFTTNQDWK